MYLLLPLLAGNVWCVLCAMITSRDPHTTHSHPHVRLQVRPLRDGHQQRLEGAAVPRLLLGYRPILLGKATSINKVR